MDQSLNPIILLGSEALNAEAILLNNRMLVRNNLHSRIISKQSVIQDCVAQELVWKYSKL